ncbi:hypothetical protein AB0I81_09640 [Nonomuraea sp. NPDC050404]|uniref:hypothetical protein n=1 Tax=Nonomuraea sp. NPDC050404 TaxID=3155783 RepID=UPI0033D005CD
MIKRRLAVLGGVAVFALAGLTGSAMANEPTPTAGSKVICKTSDGKTVEMSKALPVKEGVVVGPDGKVKRIGGGIAEGAEGEIRKAIPSDAEGVKLTPEQIKDFEKAEPAKAGEAVKLPEGGVAIAKGPDGSIQVRKLTPEEIEKAKESGELQKVVPALPAEPGKALPSGVDPSKTVKVTCEPVK